MNIIKPPPLKQGATWGIFSPSTPAAFLYEDIYLSGLSTLKNCGFKIKEGFLTATRAQQGYRSGSPQDRAREFMELYLDPKVDALMAVLGGTSTSSLIPYLDFKAIRENPKVICGFSDLTSLHMAVLHYAGLATFHGPSVVRGLGRNLELEFTLSSFMENMRGEIKKTLTPPTTWIRAPLKNSAASSHKNEGWQSLTTGVGRGPLIIANLNTLVRCAGTEFFPDLSGHILILEEMNLPLSKFERNFRQLANMGVLQKIAGLIICKPETLNLENAPFTLDDLILEILADILKVNSQLPIISNFDAGHTYPQITFAQKSIINIRSTFRSAPEINFD